MNSNHTTFLPGDLTTSQTAPPLPYTPNNDGGWLFRNSSFGRLPSGQRSGYLSVLLSQALMSRPPKIGRDIDPFYSPPTEEDIWNIVAGFIPSTYKDDEEFLKNLKANAVTKEQADELARCFIVASKYPTDSDNVIIIDSMSQYVVPSTPKGKKGFTVNDEFVAEPTKKKISVLLAGLLQGV